MAASKKEAEVHPNVVHYDRLLATVDGIERKGAGVPYTSMNGNMYSFMFGTGDVALKLPLAEREAFLAKFNTKLFDGYGMVQKEFVTIPADQLANTADFAPYMAMSHEYAKTLKPKKEKSD